MNIEHLERAIDSGCVCEVAGRGQSTIVTAMCFRGEFDSLVHSIRVAGPFDHRGRDPLLAEEATGGALEN